MSNRYYVATTTGYTNSSGQSNVGVTAMVIDRLNLHTVLASYRSEDFLTGHGKNQRAEHVYAIGNAILHAEQLNGRLDASSTNPLHSQKRWRYPRDPVQRPPQRRLLPRASPAHHR